MAKSFNFNTITKPIFNVTLPDGVLLLVKSPTKSIYTRLLKAVELAEEAVETNEAATAIALADEYFALAAEVLSNNKAGKVYSSEALEKLLTLAECQTFIKEYIVFYKESIAVNSKN